MTGSLTSSAVTTSTAWDLARRRMVEARSGKWRQIWSNHPNERVVGAAVGVKSDRT